MSESTATHICKIHDGNVLVRAGALEYLDTAENFALDSGADFPATPAGYIGRSYIPNERHRISTDRKADQLLIPWVDGDAILRAIRATIRAKELRLDAPVPSPPDTPADVRQKRIFAIEALLARQALEPNATVEEKDYQANRPDS